MTISEAQALNNLLNYFLNGGKRSHGIDTISDAEARRACAVLGKAANKALMAGHNEASAAASFDVWRNNR
jgi:hypothetical protein